MRAHGAAFLLAWCSHAWLRGRLPAGLPQQHLRISLHQRVSCLQPCACMTAQGHFPEYCFSRYQNIKQGSALFMTPELRENSGWTDACC